MGPYDTDAFKAVCASQVGTDAPLAARIPSSSSPMFTDPVPKPHEWTDDHLRSLNKLVRIVLNSGLSYGAADWLISQEIIVDTSPSISSHVWLTLCFALADPRALRVSQER